MYVGYGSFFTSWTKIKPGGTSQKLMGTYALSIMMKYELWFLVVLKAVYSCCGPCNLSKLEAEF